jgi:hypothetical protein
MTDLETLLAREAIKETKARYCLYLDARDEKGMASIFTEDAHLDSSEALAVQDAKTGAFDRPLTDGIASGNQTIAQFLMTSVAPFRTAHHVHSPIIEFESDTAAKVIWAMEDNLYCASGVPFKSLHGLGHYRETYRFDQGRWRIQTLRLTRLNVTLVGEAVS